MCVAGELGRPKPNRGVPRENGTTHRVASRKARSCMAGAINSQITELRGAPYLDANYSLQHRRLNVRIAFNAASTLARACVEYQGEIGQFWQYLSQNIALNWGFAPWSSLPSRYICHWFRAGIAKSALKVAA